MVIGGWKGWVHTVELNGLFPKTTYYYKVGSSMDNKWSHTFSFQNPASTDPSRFDSAHLSDLPFSI